MRPSVLKLFLLFSLSLNIAFLGMSAYHRFLGAHEHGSEHRANGHEQSDQGLMLSAEQEGELKRLRAAFHDRRREHEVRMTDLRRALLAELVSDAPDETRIEALVRSMGEQQSAVERELLRHLLAEKAVLRPEQRTAFQRVLERHILGAEADRPEGRAEEDHPSTQ